VRLRCGAFLLTLLVAAAPVARVVCELVCPRPQVSSVSPCHDRAADRDATAMRSPSHACGETHVESMPAILTVDNDRPQAEAFTTLWSWSQARVPPFATRTLGGLTMHGPPGLAARTPKIATTTLRI
jgi:hypothetical protein